MKPDWTWMIYADTDNYFSLGSDSDTNSADIDIHLIGILMSKFECPDTDMVWIFIIWFGYRAYHLAFRPLRPDE